MTRAEKHEQTRSINHPRRTIWQSRKLAEAGWFPFPELSEEENDVIFCARLAGFGSCYPAYPDAQSQADSTFRAAREFLASRSAPKTAGFTLIELLVVIVIIVAISAAALPTVLPALAHRQVSEAARTLQGALAGAGTPRF